MVGRDEGGGGGGYLATQWGIILLDFSNNCNVTSSWDNCHDQLFLIEISQQNLEYGITR